MKRISSFCSATCPITNCERNMENYIPEESAYDFSPSCVDYANYLSARFNDALNGTNEVKTVLNEIQIRNKEESNGNKD